MEKWKIQCPSPPIAERMGPTLHRDIQLGCQFLENEFPIAGMRQYLTDYHSRETLEIVTHAGNKVVIDSNLGFIIISTCSPYWPKVVFACSHIILLSCHESPSTWHIENKVDYDITQNVGFHLDSPASLGPRKALLVTSRVSAHAGISTCLRGKVCMRIGEPSLHTPGIQ